MYIVLIVLYSISSPDKLLKTKSVPFPTIEECVQESKRVLTFRDSGNTINGLKVKDAFCVKEKE
jgi:hypothetical protein